MIPATATSRSPIEGSVTEWSQLDRDSLTAVTSCLDDARDVAALASTCRDARSAAAGNSVWGPLMHRHFGLNVMAPDNIRLARLFRQLQSPWRRLGGMREGCAGRHGGGDGAAARDANYSGGAGLSAVRFEGLYTDGGMDGDDPAFWAGNLFVPSGWSIYCSRAGSNVHCIGLLQAALPEHPFLSPHRRGLVSLTADVAWVLFLHRAPLPVLRQLSEPCAAFGGLHERLRSCMEASLQHWSTYGLERLLMELVEWYRFLRNEERQLQLQQRQERSKQGGKKQQRQQEDGDGEDEEEGEGEDQEGAARRRGGKKQAQVAAAAVAAPEAPLSLPAGLATVVRDIEEERSYSGARGLVGLGAVGEAEEAADAAGLEVWSRCSQGWLASPALQRTTAIVDAVTVSRAGEFTCPVSAGALFLTQFRPTQLGADGAGGASGGFSGVGGGAVSGGGGAGGGHDRVRQIFTDMVLQPYVQALSGLTNAADVEAAVEEGLLPLVVARGSCAGAGEWLEFQRPPPAMDGTRRQPQQQRPASGAAAGSSEAMVCGDGADDGVAASAGADGDGRGVMWPVVWFRFFPHQGLGDEGDQAMALPPVMVIPHQHHQQQGHGPAGPVAVPGAAAAAAAGAGQIPPPGGNDHDSDGTSGSHSSGDDEDSSGDDSSSDGSDVNMLLDAEREGFSGEEEEEGGERVFTDSEEDGSISIGSTSDEEALQQQEQAMMAAVAAGGAAGAIAAAVNPAAAAVLDGLFAHNWEEELDFLYGIEGQHAPPNGAGGSGAAAAANVGHAAAPGTAPHGDTVAAASSDGSGAGGSSDSSIRRGPVAAPGDDAVGGCNAVRRIAPIRASEDPDKGGPSTSGQKRQRGQPDEDMEPGPSRGGHGGRAGGGSDGAAGSAAGNSQAGASRAHCAGMERVTRKAGGGAGARGGGGGGGGDGGDDGGHGGDGGRDVDAGGDDAYVGPGELLQGTSLAAWLRHLRQPHVLGMLLEAVADAAGVQALRHTYQNVQTVLMQELQGLQRRAASAAAVKGSVPIQAQRHRQQQGPQLAAAATAAAPAVMAVEVREGEQGSLAVLLPAEDDATVRGVTSVNGDSALFQGADAATIQLVETHTCLVHRSEQQDAQQQQPGEGRNQALAQSCSTTSTPSAAAGAAAAGVPVAGNADGATANTATVAGSVSAPPPPSGHLCMLLQQRWCGNAALVKLIAPEDRTQDFPDDEEDDMPLNIDVQFVALRGVVLALRPPLQLV